MYVIKKHKIRSMRIYTLKCVILKLFEIKTFIIHHTCTIDVLFDKKNLVLGEKPCDIIEFRIFY